MNTKKQDIIDAGIRLFCEQGYRSTGIEQILKTADVAKMTLYKHFSSKEDLIQTCLHELCERNFQFFKEEMTKVSKDPATQLESVLEPIRIAFKNGKFWGCAFVKASMEYPEIEDPIHKEAIQFKEKCQSYFQELAKAAGYKDAHSAARKTLLIMEGAMALLQMEQDPEQLDFAAETLRALLRREARG